MPIVGSQEALDFSFSSSGHGKWCLVNHDVVTPWIHLSLTEADDGATTRTLLTNDMGVVRQALLQPRARERIKSFQAVFPSNFPDNRGWGVAEIYEFVEQKTRKGMVFHTFFTRFGLGRIGGSSQTKASEVLAKDVVVLYKAESPARRYFE